jgi:hypothetical protein
MTEPALRRRRMIDALTRGKIGRLRRLNDKLTCEGQNTGRLQSDDSTYGIILVVIWFQFVPRYLPYMHTDMPHLDIYKPLALVHSRTAVILTSM